MNKLHRFATIAVLTIGLMMLAGCSGTNAPDDRVSSGQAADSSASATTGQDTNEFANVAAPSTTGALHVDDAQLIGEDGQPVQLRGVSTHGLA